VIHGFYVHAFNFSRYALPGVLNQFTIRAVNTGTFFGQCTQLCGSYHSLMWFRVKVVTPCAVPGVGSRATTTQRRASAARAAGTATKTTDLPRLCPQSETTSKGNN